MAKIGRNEPCLCGSGRKFKHCCGSQAQREAGPSDLPPEVLQRVRLEAQRQEAKEHRRRLMQGLGRPIISMESHGYRIVAVGNQLRWSKSWRTFPDFLSDYIRHVLDPAWGNAELAKPKADRHPLLTWYRKLCEWQRADVQTKTGDIYSAPITGAVKAYLGLAYDLYLCAHNVEVTDRLVKRLRNRDQFEGAVYEAFVTGCFAKAGFTIELEDEGDSRISHCEFTATHNETGRKFSVEAKAVSSASKRAGLSSEPPKIRRQLSRALRKTAPHDRIIFVELNRAQHLDNQGIPDWVEQIDQDMEKDACELTIKETPAPPAYVFVTNRAFMHDLDGTDSYEIGIACGFKIDDFPPGKNATSILAAYKARERHIEVHWLLKAMQTHNQIPSTFDDRTPEEAFSEESTARLLIGNTYLVPDESGSEVPGLLEEAAVLEGEKQATGIYKLNDGRRIMCAVPLTDDELASYRRSPETFFGIVKDVSKGIKDPLDAFDFMFEAYSQSPREKLLEFMANWSNIDSFQDLSQKELAEHYCAIMAEGMWRQISSGKTRLAD